MAAGFKSAFFLLGLSSGQEVEIVDINGVFATGYVGYVNVWGIIGDTQTPSWSDVDSSESDDWTDVVSD